MAGTRISEQEQQAQLRRAVIAATIGTTIEWYDFFLYSTVTGLVFAKLFFPHSDPLVGTLEAFAVYAVGFAARPIGAAIFGHWGDRLGRKSALIATLMLMGVATFLVGLVPTYDSIGIWGAILLTMLRFVQGIGVGGEWGGSVLLSMEWARTSQHRGFVASWPQFGVPSGLFLANLAVLVFSSMSGDAFLTWGWRVPFLISIVLVGIGLWIRLGILETPTFRRLVEENRIERAPIAEVFRLQCERGVPERVRTHGRTGAVLHLHRVRVRLWRRHAEGVARPAADRRCWRHRWSRSSRSRSRGICRTGSAASASISSARSLTGVFGWMYFAHAGHADAVLDLRRGRAVADPA